MIIFKNLITAKFLIYNECSLVFSQFYHEKEGGEYEACTFLLNENRIIYRTARITPKKIGQFVAIWKRDEEGLTTPYHLEDKFNSIIIGVQDQELSGQFIFPKSILLGKNIISSDFKEGKRGIRVYPPWVITMNKQAHKTQEWQLQYFIDTSSTKSLDLSKAKRLLNVKA